MCGQHTQCRSARLEGQYRVLRLPSGTRGATVFKKTASLMCPSLSLPARKAATVVYFTRTKCHRADAHRLHPSAVFEKTCLGKEPPVFTMCPSRDSVPAASPTRTGYRVSPRVELAGWESGVPSRLEEVSVPGFVFPLSFYAVVRTGHDTWLFWTLRRCIAQDNFHT